MRTATSPTADAPGRQFMEVARARLRQQREFRLHQLAQLGAGWGEVATDSARDAVHTALQTAARSALADVEAALRRIELGTYGRCAGCGDLLALTRLRAVPSARWCESCQRSRSGRSR